MTKQDDLKRRLKAADRRRSRRPAVVPQAGAALADSSSSTQFDVAGLCADEILKSNGRREFRDSEVVAALRSTLSGRLPRAPEAQVLHQRLALISQREGVSARAFRDAVASLARTATDHRTDDDDSAFMRFLNVLAN